MGWDADFTRCFDDCARSVRFTAFLLCGNHHEAEDIVQSAFLKLYLAGPRLGLHGDLEPYVRQVAVRTFLAERRRARWRRERLTDAVPDLPVPAMLGEDRQAVWSALAALPPRQRATVVLRFWHDLSITDAADALGCSEGNVKSQTAKALATLRARLGPTYAPITAGDR
ncbi:SigE family RNA polymerase sigma factor [Actinokineospora guangxiensis]|uniref:SigE family RNA polymerase sigma factor n=1 Tax=Actinokineospora guangxiensis TaxID=1490288 RepID=A0ABW0EWB8_9PSEU